MILTISGRKLRIFTSAQSSKKCIFLMSSFSASKDVSVPVIVFLLIIPVLVIEWLHRNDGRSSRNGRRTQKLLFGVIIVNTVFALAILLAWTVCVHCTGQISFFVSTRFLMRAMNALFLIHRAKLAQGMQPILRAKCFDKILPICTSTFFCFFAIISPLHLLSTAVYECQSYPDTDVFHHCHGREEEEAEERGSTIFHLGIDFIITVFLLTLFIVPLYRVYKTNLGMLNENQQKQREKLRKLLIWSVVLTFINQATSILTTIPTFGHSTAFMTLWTVGRMDPFINVWTSWLMITRNRQYLRKKLQFQCWSTRGTERSLAQSAFTDVDSRTTSRTSSKQWIRMPSTFNNSMKNESGSDLAVVQLEVSSEQS